MVAPQFRPLVGGYERAAERLAIALAARGHQVAVVTDRRDPAWPRKEVHEGVVIRRLWCVFRPRLHLPSSLFSLALFLITQGRRFDVWHVHQYGFHAALAVALGKVLARPVVLKLTSSGQSGIANAAGEHPLTRLVRTLLKHTPGVVSLTRETADEALAIGIPASRIHQLGNGVDTNSFRPASDEERARLKRKLGCPDRQVVLMVGRLSPEKDVEGMLRAWSRARLSISAEWTLVIVGDGPSRASLDHSLAISDFSDSVKVVGEQSNIEQWMAAADIYVSTSFYEGLSNTMLEAMASGLPVVVTRVSGVKDLVDETGAGRVVDIQGYEDLAAALVMLARDAETRLVMGKRGRAAVEKTYALDVVADRHETLYRRLMAERST